MLPPTRHAEGKDPEMNLLRHTTLVAGVAALSLAAVSPALAKGGGDINNTVVSISPTAPAPVTNTSGGGGGGGGSNRPTKCAMVGFDPVTGIIAVCSNAGA
jgi:hypothetical protein